MVGGTPLTSPSFIYWVFRTVNGPLSFTREITSTHFNQSYRPTKINSLFRSWPQIPPAHWPSLWGQLPGEVSSGGEGWAATPAGFWCQCTQRGGTLFPCRVRGICVFLKMHPDLLQGLLWKRFPRLLPSPNPVDPVLRCDHEKFLFLPGEGVKLDDPQALTKAVIPIPV